jgi:hypothetical protein
MTAAPDPADILATLNTTVEKLQKSARATLPMFAIGILATIIAAGVAVYYIVTLSADLHDARRQLTQSQAALSDAQGKLATVGQSLRQSQEHATSSAAAQTIANAISDVNSSQQSLSAVSSSINSAAARIAAPSSAEAPTGTCRLQVEGVTYIDGGCEIELIQGGSFRIWTVGRTGPSATVVRRGPNGLGSWQPAPSQATVDLGELQRKGACWFNENGQICAWK